MKKICCVTAARSEYGLLKWIMKEIDNSEEFDLQLVVTGAHLLEEQGHTIDAIISDGFKITEVADAHIDTGSNESIAESMGRIAQMFSHVFAKLNPDYLMVLGDRYELLPIVNTAFVMHIPIIHVSGGDVTEGALDDGIRNAVTMLSDYHFPGTEFSAKNIIRMRGSDHNVWNVGEPGLDSFFRESLLDRQELSDNLGLSLNEKWALFTYHAETKESLEYNVSAVKNCLYALLEFDVQIVATYSNADFGGREINEYLEETAIEYPQKIKVVPSLGNLRYLSLMKQVSFVMGNSSSGIVEAPTLGIPVINVGNRQKGRFLCENIIQVDPVEMNIKEAISHALSSEGLRPDNYWGDGHTAEKVIHIMKRELC